MLKSGFSIIIFCIGLLRLAISTEPEYVNEHMQELLVEEAGYTGTGGNVTIPLSVREYWMRRANEALFELQGPCPFQAFGSVIVNHSRPGDDGIGELVCMGANGMASKGNPTLHGEIAVINNCSDVLTDPDGLYKLSPQDSLLAFRDLSLYTNGESCPMCASAIRWAGFKEYIYGTTIKTLTEKGFSQISIDSADVFEQAHGLAGNTMIIPEVLMNETDPLFSWQFNPEYPCPKGCERPADGGICMAVER